MAKENLPPRAARILDTAAKLIAHYGYDKTTVSDIARETGISKGAVYLHWPSKEALFDELLVREMQQVMEDILRRITGDPAGGTIGKMYQHTLLALQDRPLLKALYTRDARILGDYVHRQDPARYTQRLFFGVDFVSHLQKSGLLREDLSPASIAYLMAIIAYGFMGIQSLIPAEQAPPLEETSAALVELIQGGLARADGDSAAGKQALTQMTEAVLQQYPASTSTE